MVDNTEESYHIEFFIGSGRHAAFRKYVNGDNRLTQLFFTTRIFYKDGKFGQNGKKVLEVAGYLFEKCWRGNLNTVRCDNPMCNECNNNNI